MRFYTSDLHLGHANIVTYCNRPYDSVEQMNADLVERWNTRVGLDDEVWVVGDFAMGRLGDSLAYASQLNGTKVLIPGNHDRMFGTQGTKFLNASNRYIDAGFDTIFGTNDDSYDTITHLPCGRMVLVSHFPYVEDSRHGDRFAECRPVDSGLALIHGHTHGMWRRRGRMVDVGVDAWGGFPVSENLVRDLLTNMPEDVDPLPWV